MSEQEHSIRNKRKKIRHANPGSLSFLTNKKRRLLKTNSIVEGIKSKKENLLKLIEKYLV